MRCSRKDARARRWCRKWATSTWIVRTTIVPPAKGGPFPLDAQLGVAGQRCSEQVAKHAVWLIGQVDDDFAEQGFAKIGGLSLSDKTIGRQQGRWGEQIRVQEAAQAETASALPLRGQASPTTLHDAQDRGVALDGGVVFVRQEGWRELKAGCVFDIALQLEIVKDTEETEWSAHAVNTRYLGVLGGPERRGQQVWAEACRRRVPQAHDSLVCGEGAPWICATGIPLGELGRRAFRR